MVTTAIAASVYSPVPEAARAASERAFCRNANQVSSSTKLGSQVDGDVVTICLSKDLIKKLQTKKPTLKVVPVGPAPVRTAPVKAQPRPVPKPTTKQAILPSKKPAKPVVRVTSRPKPKATTSAKRGSNAGTFRPQVLPLLVSPTRAVPHETVMASTSQLTQFGKTVLMGKRVEVRFSPLTLRLDFGDGTLKTQQSQAGHFTHSFSAVGSFLLTLRVIFRVEYRLRGGTWFRDPQTIELVAPQVEVQVGQVAQNSSSSNVVLVTPNR